MSQRIAAVTLVVPEYDEAISYFCGVLGFELAEDTSLGAGKRWVVVRAGGAAGSGRDHARYVAAGVRFVEVPRTEPYGTVAVFEDAFGNRWDLIEPAEPPAAQPSSFSSSS